MGIGNDRVEALFLRGGEVGGSVKYGVGGELLWVGT